MESVWIADKGKEEQEEEEKTDEDDDSDCDGDEGEREKTVEVVKLNPVMSLNGGDRSRGR